jgi:hypothetical protein
MGKPKSGYWQANQGFATTFEGEPYFLQKGELVPDGHPILKGREDLFEPALRVTRFDPEPKSEPVVEQATSAPGEKRRRGRPPKVRQPEPEPTPEPEPEQPKHFGLTTSDVTLPPSRTAD